MITKADKIEIAIIKGANVQLGETPEGIQFSVSSRREAARLMEGGIRSQQAFEKMAGSLVAAFEWLDTADMTEVDRQAAADELYAYAEGHGIIHDDVDYLRSEAALAYDARHDERSQEE